MYGGSARIFRADLAEMICPAVWKEDGGDFHIEGGDHEHSLRTETD